MRNVNFGYAIFVAGKTGSALERKSSELLLWTVLPHQSHSSSPGEAIADRELKLSLHHCVSSDPVQTTVMTDVNGLVALGQLPDMTVLQVESLGEDSRGKSRSWELTTAVQDYPKAINGGEGQVLRVPLGAAPERVSLRDFSLVEIGTTSG